jgi:hypothetical protein
MTGDAEERRLLEIETLLRAYDPDFVRRFDSRWRMPRRWRILALSTIPVALLVVVVALAVGSLLAAVAGLAILGTALGVWVTHRT